MEDLELLESFLAESQDMLDEVEPTLIQMQKNAEDTGDIDSETINAIFRAFHSMKGSAGFLQFSTVSAVTHEAETLLDMLRKGKMSFTQEHTELLIEECDFVRKLLDSISTTHNDGGFDDDAAVIIKKLQSSMSGEAAPAADKPAPPPPPPPEPTAEPEPQKAPDPAPQPAPPAPPPSDSMTQMLSPEMISVFVQDSEELMESAEQALLELNKNPDNTDSIPEVLRAIHTFKGNSGLLGLNEVNELSHRMETLLQCVRDGQAPLSEDSLRILLKIIDVFRKTITNLSQGESVTIMGFPGLMELLQEMIPEEARPTAPVVADDLAPLDDEDFAPLSEEDFAPPEEPAAPVEEAKEEISTPPAEEPTPPPAASPTPEEPPAAPPEAEAEAPKAAEPPPEPTPPAPAGKKEETSKPAPQQKQKTVVRRDIRVNVDKLEQLFDLVGELVIAEAMVTHNEDLKDMRMDSFDRAAHRLSLITNDLQDVAMSLRMIPVGGTFRKMIRLVHDLSTKAGKKVNLELLGEDTEVDRNVVELISDPLVHLVRNAVDHGLEGPEERIDACKPEEGSVIIEAKHQSGEVWIIIKDDGRGLNKDKILARALERGVFTGDPSTLRDEDIYKFIFQPGFSTAEKVTDVSGRGVGMDVVKKNIEKIKGHVEIHSTPGKGSTFIIRIPLTLAIIQGMMLRVGNERYVIPLLNIRESFRPTEEMLNSVQNRGELISIRGELLPLFRLNRLFDITEGFTDPCEGIIVVIEDTGKRTAILVDELLGQQQVVIKSLDNVSGDTEGISGACILNDGRVGLILDVRGIILMATEEVEQYN